MTHKDKFVSLIEQVADGGSKQQVFNDFLKIAATSLARFDDSDDTVKQEREKIFLETIGRYDGEKKNLFVDMLAELGSALNESAYCDVLGDVFQKSNFNEQKGGQVFTPQHKGDLMGELALDKDFVQSEIQRRGYISIVEPCCGSGAITLGAINALEKIGVNPRCQCAVFAYDLDERCILMAYIQLKLYGIPAIVMLRNALTDEVFGAAWKT